MTPATEEISADIFRIPLPIPFDAGPVNAVLLRGEAPALVDCGVRSEAAWEALTAALAHLGTPPARLATILLTHDHIDHYGNLGRLAEAAPEARLLAHEDSFEGIFDHSGHMARKTPSVEARARSWGFSDRAIEATRRSYEGFAAMAAESVPTARAEALRGARIPLALAGREVLAIHTPGHAEGHVVLHLPAEGILLAGDHVLEHITPNPTAYHHPRNGCRNGLPDYVESLARLRDLPVSRVVPGHGASFPGLAARVDEILLHHERRAAKVLGLVRDAGPITVLALAQLVWPDLPKGERFLACREMEGHLDLLIAAGRVRELPRDAEGAMRFEGV